MQLALDAVTTWSIDWEMLLSAQKSVYSFFSATSHESKWPPTLNCLFVFVDLPVSRNSTGTLLCYWRQADVLSISTNISLTSIIEKFRLTLCFYITRRQFIN